jgi:hypothetical protein
MPICFDMVAIEKKKFPTMATFIKQILGIPTN